jgi:mxaD protein
MYLGEPRRLCMHDVMIVCDNNDFAQPIESQSRLTVESRSSSMGVQVIEVIAAPLEAVWSIVGNFAGLQRWHPAVQRCVMQGSGTGATRTVYFVDWHAEERLDLLDPEKHQLQYTVIGCSRRELLGISSRITLKKIDSQGTSIDWSAWLGPECPPEMELFLKAYYPKRIQQLREALDRESRH